MLDVSVFDGDQQSAGLIPALNLLNGELFPTKIRATSSGIVLASSYIALMGNYKVYPILIETFGLHHLMYLYAVITAFMVIWGGLKIKDTDKLSLTEIQDMHKKTDVSGITSKNKGENKEKEEGNVINGNAIRINV